MPIRAALAGLSLLSLAACVTPPTTTSVAPQAAAAQTEAGTFLYAQALFGDPVFDRDVRTFANALSSASGAPERQVLIGQNGGGLASPPSNPAGVLAGLAQDATDGTDVVVVMFTSHGAPESIAIQSGRNGPIAGITGPELNALLAPLSQDRQIVILQACYSGSLIDDISAPNRIVITAAAADRPSFGCNPDNDNTWFIRSLNTALRQGGTWAEVFARTRAIVAEAERAAGLPASNPQVDVGRNMRDIWNGPV